MSECFTPGTEFPVVILLGADGSGKESISRQLGNRLALGVLTNQEYAFEGQNIGSLLIDDPEATLEALSVAAVEILQPGGAGAGQILVLNASAPLTPSVSKAVAEAKAGGSRVVALTASLDTLARRNGLNAARPTALGMPRAWFRTQLKAVEEAYSHLADHWCDTGTDTPEECALRIIEEVGLPKPRSHAN